MAKYLIILLMFVASSNGYCTFTIGRNHRGHVSCTNTSPEDYLRSIFEIKSNVIDSITRISIDIKDSYVLTIDDWLFLPWEDQFIVHSIKIVNSSLNTVKHVAKLPMVETLDLSGNNISDYKFLNKMKKLRQLHLSHSKFSSDSYLFNYLQKQQTRLQLVDLSHCNLEYFGVITNLIDSYDFSFNPNLTLIEFEHKVGYRAPFLRLRGIDNVIIFKHLKSPECFRISLDLSFSSKGLDTLLSNTIHITEKLLLNNNNMSSLNESLFKLSKFISLKCLSRFSVDISNSSLNHISSYFFSDYTLNVLNLSNNNLDTLNGSIFRESNILHLDLSSANISSISSSIFNLLVVNTLDLSRNQLSNLDGVFNYIESVNHLDISSNPIEALSDKVFKNCRNLESLNLANVFIKTASDDMFLHLTSLRLLILSFKDSINSASIRNMHVSELTITNTTVTRLEPEQFGGFFKLQTLTFLDSLSISSIDSAAFKGLYNLKRFTNLKKFGNYDLSIFQQLYSLDYLDLSAHKLTKINLELRDLYSLKRLNLSSNAISSLDVNSLSNLKQLEILSLTDNALSTLIVGTFRGLTKLTHLYLNKNQLQQLMPGIFSGLDSLFWLDLSHNDLLRTKPHLILGVSIPKLAHLFLQNNGVGNEYAKGDDMLRRNEFSVIANHDSLKYVDINKNGWRCSTIVDILVLFKTRNISYIPTSPELKTSNINGISCT